MKKIRYNISSEKKPNTRRIFFLAAVLAGFSLICISIGVWKLSTQTRYKRIEVEELKKLKEKLADMSNQSVSYTNKINRIKKVWGKKINFSNLLIDHKGYSLVEKLNDLESRVPAGVFVNSLGISADSQSMIRIGFISHSFNNLMILYKQLSGYHIQIKKETVLPDGLYSTELDLKPKDEKN